MPEVSNKKYNKTYIKINRLYKVKIAVNLLKKLPNILNKFSSIFKTKSTNSISWIIILFWNTKNDLYYQLS